MSEYDYGNARLRAMKSRLLNADQLAALAEAHSIDLFISQLSKTPYQRAVEIAIIRAVGFERITVMLRYHLVETVTKIQRFYSGTAQELLAILLTRYDIHNLKAILRGLSQFVPPNQIMATLLPIGELTPNILTQLAQAEKPSAVVDMLASMRFVIAHPLIGLRSQSLNASVADMELCLERWHFLYATETLLRLRQYDSALTAALKLEADVINLLVTLRFIHFSPTQQMVESLYVKAGHLSHPLLVQAAHTTMQEAITVLRSTPYGGVLTESWNRYHKTKLLSEFERGLHRYRTRALAQNIARDPLGIGVPLGYWALKDNEIRNLRAIAWGIHLGHTPDAIKQSLELAA